LPRRSADLRCWNDALAGPPVFRSGNTPGVHQENGQRESWWNRNGHSGE
jgi:hypothetical protein